MRTSPSIAHHGAEQDTYLVLADFGRSGRSWRETDEDTADRGKLIRDLFAGELNGQSASSPSIPLKDGLAT